MRKRISTPTREELVDALGDRYRAASKEEKSVILDEFVKVTGYHRKHAIRLLQRGLSAGPKGGGHAEKVYDEAVREALVVTWEAADRICGKRLKSILPSMVSSRMAPD